MTDGLSPVYYVGLADAKRGNPSLLLPFCKEEGLLCPVAGKRQIICPLPPSNNPPISHEGKRETEKKREGSCDRISPLPPPPSVPRTSGPPSFLAGILLGGGEGGFDSWFPIAGPCTSVLAAVKRSTSFLPPSLLRNLDLISRFFDRRTKGTYVTAKEDTFSLLRAKCVSASACLGMCMSSLSGQYRERTIQELYKRSACSVLRRLSLLFPTDRCTHSNFRAFVSGKGGEETGGLYYVPTYSVFFFVRYNNNIGYFGFSN